MDEGQQNLDRGMRAVGEFSLRGCAGCLDRLPAHQRVQGQMVQPEGPLDGRHVRSECDSVLLMQRLLTIQCYNFVWEKKGKYLVRKAVHMG